MHIIYETSNVLFLTAYPGLVMNSGPLAGLAMTQKNHYHVAQAERHLLEIETDLRTLGVVRIHVCVCMTCDMYMLVQVTCACI